MVRKGKEMKQDKIVKQGDRKIVSNYTLDNNYRVKVSTYHYANAKVIRSTISECITSESGIFTMETHRVFTDYNAIVLSERVARYSFKTLEDQHARAIELAAPTVASLLEQGERRARDCQTEAVA